MPSGYTADIYEGKDGSFKDFVMKCARAMGACVTMRDDSMDAKIPEFVASDYYKNDIVEARNELGRLLEMTHEQHEAAADQDYRATLVARENCIAKDQALKDRYEAMLDQVRAWDPPTLEHVDFKVFMIKQLMDSIKHDCNMEYYKKYPVVRQTGEEWFCGKVADVERRVSRSCEEWDKEQERVAGRNAWIAALRKSLEVNDEKENNAPANA